MGAAGGTTRGLGRLPCNERRCAMPPRHGPSVRGQACAREAWKQAADACRVGRHCHTYGRRPVSTEPRVGAQYLYACRVRGCAARHVCERACVREGENNEERAHACVCVCVCVFR